MAEHDADEWQDAMEALLLVAEQDGPPLFARIGIMRAINRHVERVFDPSRKEKHCGTAEDAPNDEVCFWRRLTNNGRPRETAGLALQLPFCFEVRTPSDRLVSSAPE